MIREMTLIMWRIDEMIEQQMKEADFYDSGRERFKAYTHRYCAERLKDLKTDIEDIYS